MEEYFLLRMFQTIIKKLKATPDVWKSENRTKMITYSGLLLHSGSD